MIFCKNNINYFFDKLHFYIPTQSLQWYTIRHKCLWLNNCNWSCQPLISFLLLPVIKLFDFKPDWLAVNHDQCDREGSAPEIVVPDLWGSKCEILDIGVVEGVAAALSELLSEERFHVKTWTNKGVQYSTASRRRVSGTSLLPTGLFRLLLSSSTGGRSSAGLNVIHHMVYPITLTFFCLPHCKWHHWACYPMDMWNYSCTSQEWSIETEVQCFEFFAK